MRRMLTVVTVILAVLAAGSLSAAEEPSVVRVAGDDRVATGVAVSEEHWDSADAALLATARDFPDALAAGALADQLDAPLLLSEPSALPSAVAEELQRLDVAEVVMVGGAAALSESVEADVEALGVEVRRIAGSNRYETAALLLAEIDDPPSIAVASGEDFPDALSAATLAAKADIPVLLTRPDRLPGETSRAIEALAPDQVIAIGGSAVLSEAVREDLDALVADSPWPEDLRLTWIAGSNRYHTSRQTAGVAPDGSPADGSPVVLTTGEDFPDALAAGALAARVDGYLLLTRPDRLSDAADDLIRTASDWFGSAIVVGGSAAVDDFVLEEVGAALAGRPRPVPPDLRLPPAPPPELDPEPDP